MDRDIIKITFLGDVMCDKVMSDELQNYYNCETKEYNFDSVFAPIKTMLSKADYVLANLETPISKDRNKYTRTQWEFCSAYEFARALKQAGIDFVATANNHCLDNGGARGLEETIRCLDEIGFSHTGTYSQGGKSPLIVDVRGVKIGILSYTYGTNAFSNNYYLKFKDRTKVDLFQEQEEWLWSRRLSAAFIRKYPQLFVSKIVRRIRQKLTMPWNRGKKEYEKRTIDIYRRMLLKRDLYRLKKLGSDIIAVYAHVGGQYGVRPTSYTECIVKRLIKQGANIVIGNHEHVIHGCVGCIADGQFATYAIGNLLGSAGTKEPPYNRRSDYSIAVHAYIDSCTRRIQDITFSVLKTIYNEETRKFEVWPAWNLWKKCMADEEKLLNERDVLDAARDFSGKEWKTILEEYPLFGQYTES